MKKAILAFFLFVLAVSLGAQQAKPSIDQNKENPVASSKIDPKLEVQIWLDRKHFSPGEIDGTIGKNTEKALATFQEAHQIPVTTNPTDAKTLEALREEGVEPLIEYTIKQEDVKGPFIEKIPADFMEQAKLKSLTYTSAVEALSEKFHVSPEVFKKLNPKSDLSAGSKIQVPNVLETQKTASTTDQKKVEPVTGKKEAKTAAKSNTGGNSIVLSKEKQQLMVKDADGETIFWAPITAGSDQYPYPIGVWKVNGVAKNPTFNYNPELFKDSKPTHKKTKLPPGPNNPVGTVWIDLSAPHYGLHGTPEPGKIGYSESHGCIRLTNWDVQKLALLVKVGTPVIFE